ncbi:MAG: hypothetical protein AAF902_04415, partial [Chloroflexota bacterium]
MCNSIRILAEIKRKAVQLPRFVEVDASAIVAWQLEGTSPIMVQIEGNEPVRRNIKPWGKDRSVWFFELTELMSKKTNVDTGDTVEFTLTKLEDTLAAEIEEIITTFLEAQIKWDEMTISQRRVLNEHILSGK